MRSRAVAVLVWGLGMAALGGCDLADALGGGPERQRGGRWSVYLVYDFVYSSLVPGDTVTIGAGAGGCDFAVLVCPSASSATEPERFQWRSHNPAVADVTPAGLVRARALGDARLEVTFLGEHGGGTSSTVITVLPPISAVVLRLSRDTVRVGQLVTATIGGVDAAGRGVPRAGVRYAYYPQMLEVVGTPAYEPGGTGFYTVTFLALAPAAADVRAFRPHARYSQELWAAESLVVTPAAAAR